jgi:hypothetical protein
MSSLKQRNKLRRSKFRERTLFTFAFADGEVVRVTHPSDTRKPCNWGPALRIAREFWLLRQSSRHAKALGLSGEGYVRVCAEWERNHYAPRIIARTAAAQV